MADGQCAVLVEETTGGYFGRRISTRRTFTDRAEAREAALHLAHNHLPEHPWSPQSRAVYRHDDDNYTVIVEGKTDDFYFNVAVADVVT